MRYLNPPQVEVFQITAKLMHIYSITKVELHHNAYIINHCKLSLSAKVKSDLQSKQLNKIYMMPDLQ